MENNNMDGFNRLLDSISKSVVNILDGIGMAIMIFVLMSLVTWIMWLASWGPFKH